MMLMMLMRARRGRIAQRGRIATDLGREQRRRRLEEQGEPRSAELAVAFEVGTQPARVVGRDVRQAEVVAAVRRVRFRGHVGRREQCVEVTPPFEFQSRHHTIMSTM